MRAAAMHVNELSMEQWWLFTLMNINEGTKIEGLRLKQHEILLS